MEARAKRRVFKELADSSEESVWVYSIGKGGSTAIGNTLRQAGVRAQQMHSLIPTRLAALAASYRLSGRVPFRHVWASEYFIKNPPTIQKPRRVICPIREPIARDIAGHFQVTGRLGVTQHPDPARLMNAETLAWFDIELMPALGIDVYDAPFDHEQGWQIYHTHAIDLLVIRQESLAVEPLAAFVGVDLPELARSNAADSKDYADEYRSYLEGVRLDGEVVERVYSSRFASHFYGPAEIQQFKERWSSGKSIVPE